MLLLLTMVDHSSCHRREIARRTIMNEDVVNMEIRKFLKKVGITSQREIEKALQAAVEGGKLSGSEQVAVSIKLEMPSIGLEHTVEGSIALE
jgi:hypothetical protein